MSKPLSTEEQRRLNNERTRAVNQAKRDEVALIKEGKGTRDWTREQQKEWLQTGKCHGIKGHHMKDVSNHPEYAGDKNNIQLLDKNEHLAAHRGDYKNSTNGYYNPKTGRINDFGNNPPTKPKAERLSDPLSERSVKYNSTMRKNADAQKAEAKKRAAEGKNQKNSKGRVPENTDSKTLSKTRNNPSTAKKSTSTESKTLANNRAKSGKSKPEETKGETHSHKIRHSH